jgi:hypothetical protein
VRCDRFLIALTLIAAACGEGPTAPQQLLDAPAFAVIADSNIQVELNQFPVYMPCANGGLGEWILIEGFLHVHDRLMLDSAGRLTLVSHVNPHGVSGVGLDTGETYRGTGATRTVTPVSGSGAFQSNNSFLLISQGSAPNLRVHEKRYGIVDDFGQLQTTRHDVTVKCGSETQSTVIK